jgi:hypothetical protein
MILQYISKRLNVSFLGRFNRTNIFDYSGHREIKNDWGGRSHNERIVLKFGGWRH